MHVRKTIIKKLFFKSSDSFQQQITSKSDSSHARFSLRATVKNVNFNHHHHHHCAGPEWYFYCAIRRPVHIFTLLNIHGRGKKTNSETEIKNVHKNSSSSNDAIAMRVIIVFVSAVHYLGFGAKFESRWRINMYGALVVNIAQFSHVIIAQRRVANVLIFVWRDASLTRLSFCNPLNETRMF